MTELDYTVLALVARDGPLSAYDVRKDFAASLTPTWSSSTGSIYPSIRRLLGARFIKASRPSGARAKQELTVTTSGGAALRKWLSSVTPKIASATPDPIRTRAHFLRLLDKKTRLKFLTDARRSTETAIATAERRRDERLQAGMSRLEVIAGSGVLYELKARREWLDLLLRELE